MKHTCCRNSPPITHLHICSCAQSVGPLLIDLEGKEEREFSTHLRHRTQTLKHIIKSGRDTADTYLQVNNEIPCLATGRQIDIDVCSFEDVQLRQPLVRQSKLHREVLVVPRCQSLSQLRLY